MSLYDRAARFVQATIWVTALLLIAIGILAIIQAILVIHGLP